MHSVRKMRNFIMLHQMVYIIITFFFCDKQPKLSLGRLNAEVARSYTDTHASARQDFSARVITLSHRPLPTQHTTNTRGEQPYPQRASNRQSQQSRQLQTYAVDRAATGVSMYSPFFFVALRPNASHGLLILEVSRSNTTPHHSR
jgi:hypothetical protein